MAVCVVMPTGAGKTVLGVEYARMHLVKRPDGKVLWVAHREELVDQAYIAMTAAGLSCGVIQPNSIPERTNPNRPVQIASIQTLIARKLVPEVSFAIFDEFHHYCDDITWTSLALEYRKQRVPLVGLTATPVRADGRGYKGIVDELVTPVTMKQLISGGFLTPFELIAPKQKLGSNELAMSPVKALQKYAHNRKTILFAPNVKTAKEYTAEFRATGVTAETIWGDMDGGSRARVLDAFRDGTIQVLTNVAVLTEGFDDRPTSCVILARSVGSLSLYLQICGRGLRVSCETGKTNAIIIDLHGSCNDPNIGAPDDDREWSLDGKGPARKNLQQPTERFCAVCQVLLDKDAGNVCDLCGIARPELVTPSIVDVELVRYAAKRREPEHIRKAYFEKLKLIARKNGWNRWQPHVMYKVLYGSNPPREWH